MASDSTTYSTNPTGVNTDGTWIGWPLYDWAYFSLAEGWVPTGDPYPGTTLPTPPYPTAGVLPTPLIAQYYDLGPNDSIVLNPWSYNWPMFASGEIRIRVEWIRIQGPAKGTLLVYGWGPGSDAVPVEGVYTAVAFRYGKQPYDFVWYPLPPPPPPVPPPPPPLGSRIRFGTTGDNYPLTGEN
jgi:hypothetical protein